ncbi:hypothetical protein [Microbacterium saperdae]|uniref:Uncharacterized protein n=1 Tax=Microbacterium saperdae TaxID=69368 RepID=A0A543BBA2_9MICO|nr:hypothetical protein [Microbacterium saperdae]TQL82130.1 hypothetical protein FB560_3613 [Microbacterium saperdae]GGM37430.1 hypothetical protein GCM10010489_05500 [Microbacterium saperdae]
MDMVIVLAALLTVVALLVVGISKVAAAAARRGSVSRVVSRWVTGLMVAGPGLAVVWLLYGQIQALRDDVSAYDREMVVATLILLSFVICWTAALLTFAIGAGAQALRRRHTPDYR